MEFVYVRLSIHANIYMCLAHRQSDVDPTYTFLIYASSNPTVIDSLVGAFSSSTDLPQM